MTESAGLSIVRRVALALPETTERLTHGQPGFRVKDRLFACVSTRDQALLVVWVTDEGEKLALLASDSAVFSTTPHYEGHNSVLVRMAAATEVQLRELLTDAWRARAPVRVRGLLDG